MPMQITKVRCQKISQGEDRRTMGVLHVITGDYQFEFTFNHEVKL